MVRSRSWKVGRTRMDLGECKPVFDRGRQLGIAQIHPRSKTRPQDLSSRFRFLRAKLWRTTSAHLTPSQIDDSDGIASINHFEQCASRSEFHIVRMRSNRENVYAFHNRSNTPSNFPGRNWKAASP